MKKVVHWLTVLVVLGLVAFSLQALFGGPFFDAHDSIYHLARAREFHRAVSAGQLPPRWAPGLVNGLGTPVFNYLYPLFYYLTEVFVLVGLSAATACKIVLVLACLGGLTFMTLFLRDYFSLLPSLIGGFFFVFAPYMFLDLYVRGTFAEYLGFMLLPLVFWALKQALDRGRAGWLPLIFGLLILSHNFIAMLATAWLVCFALIGLLMTDKAKEKILPLGTFFVLGLAVAAFFWLPAVLEIPHTHLVEEKVYSWVDHFPTIRQLLYSPWGYGSSLPGPGDYLSFQIGPIHLLLAGISFLIFLKRQLKSLPWRQIDRWYIFFVASAGGLIFLMNHRSAFLWRNLPFLEWAQFPWRLLGFLLLALSFLISYGLENILQNWSGKLILTGGLLLLVLLLTFYFYRSYPHPKAYQTIAEALESRRAKGTTSAGNELLPVNAPKENPLAIEQDNLITCQPFSCQTTIDSKQEKQLTFAKFYFPTWQATIDGQKATLEPDRRGLASLTVPAGHHEVKVFFRQTRLERIGNFISLAALMILLGQVLI